MSLRGTLAEAGGPKQSHNALKARRLPRSLRSLAMTKRDSDTATRGGRNEEAFCDRFVRHKYIYFSFKIGVSPYLLMCSRAASLDKLR
jgi:hypothetical protein